MQLNCNNIVIISKILTISDQKRMIFGKKKGFGGNRNPFLDHFSVLRTDLYDLIHLKFSAVDIKCGTDSDVNFSFAQISYGNNIFI